MTSTSAALPAESPRVRGRLSLTPLKAAPPPTAPPADDQPLNPRAVAERVTQLCMLILNGMRPTTDMRRLASPRGYVQFVQMCRDVRVLARGADLVAVRASRSASAASGAVEIVAMVRMRQRVRALALQATVSGDSRWRLTACSLV
ncbi:MAG: Rv3235 family protein [Stackebrandtia sp.]